jgi:hypothetical protein
MLPNKSQEGLNFDHFQAFLNENIFLPSIWVEQLFAIFGLTFG